MTYSDRVGIRDALRARVAAVCAADNDLNTVGVFYDEPGEEATKEALWFGDVTGSQESDTMGGDRPGRTDDWNLETVIATAGHADAKTADTRAQEILTGFCEAAFVAPRISASFPSVSLHPGRMDGPYAFKPAKDLPYASVIVLTVQVRVPIRGS